MSVVYGGSGCESGRGNEDLGEIVQYLEKLSVESMLKLVFSFSIGTAEST